MAKSAGEMVAEANAAINVIDVEEAKSLVGKDDVVFIDVREKEEVAKGVIPGAVHVSRGILEFVTDPNSPMHNPVLSSGKQVVVYCASGGRSALAGKTMQDMGVKRVANMKGGFTAWTASGGETTS
ncbi:MAG: rhodanese-like domain-containing protein [Pseudomonadota bacterium]